MKQKQHKRFTKRKLKKATNGAISILLCVLLTPFLTITLGLVEYARYQQVIEITDELMELTGISVLSDYDTYIHNRFGLLCTSQEQELGEGTQEYLEENVKILGKQVTVEESSIKGANALMDVDVLRHQVVNVSEFTSTTAVLAKDFKLEELLEKLQGVSQFQDVMETIEGLADFAESLNTALDKLEALKNSLIELQGSVTSSINLAKDLARKMQTLYGELYEYGLTLSEDASSQEINAAIETFFLANQLGVTFLDNLKEIYELGGTVISSFDTIKENMENVRTAIDEFKESVEAAKTASQNIKKSNSADADGTNAEVVTETLDSVLDEMIELTDSTLEDISNETFETAKETLDEIVDTTLESTGLPEITTRYTQIVNGTYFKTPLTETAKADLVDILKLAGELYSTKDANGVVAFLESKFVPDINFSNILSSVTEIASRAAGVLTDSVTEKVVDLLAQLLNLVKKIFNLNLFYNPDLNSFVNVGTSTDSPYQKFIEGIGDLFTAGDVFINSARHLNPSGILGALADMLYSVCDILQSIFEVLADSIMNIASLISKVFGADVRGIYEELLIAGYMRHNLPCRLDVGDYVSADKQVKLTLEGSGLTGFEYDNIARPARYTGQLREFSGFAGLTAFINDLKAGAGPDKMFKGAELEYIFSGTNSEIVNQIVVFFNLYFFRLLVDLPSVLADPEVASIAGSATIACWVVYLIYILLEPLCDTVLLVNDVSIPLIRAEGCWVTPSGIGDFIEIISSEASQVMSDDIKNELNSFAEDYLTTKLGGKSPASEDGQCYQTHIMLLLLIHTGGDTMISRLKDLVELEAAEYYNQQGMTFNRNKTYTTLTVEADVEFHPFFDLGTYNGGSPLSISGTLKQSFSY